MSNYDGGGGPGEPDTSPNVTTFEAVLPQAEKVADSGPNIREELKTVLSQAVGFTPGEQAQIVEVGAKACKLGASTVWAMLRDEQCKFGQHGVLTTPTAVAEAWLQDSATGPDGAIIVHTEGNFVFRFNDPLDKPYYQRLERADIEANLMRDLPLHPLVQTASRRREVVDEIARLCLEPDFFGAELPGLQLLNGFLTIDPATGEVRLRENSPEIRSRWVVAVEYDPDAACPVFTAGLDLIMPDEQSRDSLLENLGAAVLGLHLPGDNANSIVLVVGPAQAGKSTLLGMLRMLVPPFMCAALQPADMTEQFMAGELEGKRLNLLAELDISRDIGGAKLKAICSREPITIRGIRERPRTMTSRATHVWLANEKPKIKDKTGAFSRRISAYQLTRALTREEIDPNFLDKIAAELPGIVNLVVRHASNAVRRGYFLRPTEQDEMMAEMMGQHDIFAQAITEGVERKLGSRLKNHELFEFVRQFGTANGVDLGHLKSVAMGRRLAKAMREQLRIEPSPTKGHGGVPYYEGVAFKHLP
jgi:energy-coupling factor transporter ATP-binding protein EcfA2